MGKHGMVLLGHPTLVYMCRCAHFYFFVFDTGLPINKLVLGAVSPMMKSIFSNICPCSSVSLVVPGVDPQVSRIDTLSSILKFCFDFQQLKLFASLINHQNYDPEQYHQSNGNFIHITQIQI